MKRSGLRRVAPMRTTRLVAGSKRSGSTRGRDTGPDAATRALVLARAEHRCERCDGPLDSWQGYSIHHRLPRSRGRDNSAANLVALCGSGTSPGCHALVESQRATAYLAGFLLRSGQDPTSEPVALRDGWHYLAADGSKVPA